MGRQTRSSPGPGSDDASILARIFLVVVAPCISHKENPTRMRGGRAVTRRELRQATLGGIPELQILQSQCWKSQMMMSRWGRMLNRQSGIAFAASCTFKVLNVSLHRMSTHIDVLIFGYSQSEKDPCSL